MMRRLFAAVLIAAIVAADISVCSAANVQTSVLQPRLGLLEALGIKDENDEINGRLITRAEFLSYVIAALDENIGYDNNEPIFNDVTVGHKYYDEIVYAYQRGYISGAGDKKFYPDDYITFEDAGIIMLNAMGYKMAAQSMGYFSVAAAVGLFENMKNGRQDPVTDKEVWALIYNMLFADYPDISYSKESNELKRSDLTVIEKVRKIYSKEGVVTASGAMSVFSEFDYGGFDAIIDGEKYRTANFQTDEFFGMNICFYYSEEEGEKNIIFAYPKNNSIKTYKSEEYKDIYEHSIRFDGKVKSEVCMINSDTALFWNGKPQMTSEFLGHLGADGAEYTLIDNNSDGIYDFFLISEAKVFSEGFVDAAEYTVTDSKINSVRLKNYAAYFIFDENGKELNFSNLKKDGVFLVYDPKDYAYPVKLIAVEKTAEGIITKISSDKREIVLDNETCLEVAYNFKFGFEKLELGKRYKLYIAPNGLVIDARQLDGDGYEAVYILGKNIKDIAGAKIRVLNEKGEKELLTLAELMIITDKNSNTYSLSPKKLFDTLDEEANVFSRFLFIKKDSKGMVKKIIQISENFDAPYHKQDFETMSENSARRWISNNYSLENQIQLKSSTKIFVVPYWDLPKQEDKYYSVKGCEIFKNNDTYRINECFPRVKDQLVGTPVVVEAGGLRADYLVLECPEGKGFEATSTKYGLITGFYTSFDAEANERFNVIKLLNHQGSELEVKYQPDDKDYIQIGDVVQINDTGSYVADNDILIYYDRDKDKFNYFTYYDKGTGVNEIGYRYYGFRISKGKVLKIKDGYAYCELMRDNESTRIKEYIPLSKGKIISFKDKGKADYTVKNINYLKENDEFFAIMIDGMFLYIVEF